MPRRSDWYLFSIHGLVFLTLARHGDLTVDQIATAINRSRWTVIRILRDLQDGGYVSVARKATRNMYTLNPDAAFQNSVLGDKKVGLLMDLVSEDQSGLRPE